VWKLLQAFYANFPQYENRDFAIFTESYGGHYGPGERPLTLGDLLLNFSALEFTTYFESQNSAIEAGLIAGHKILVIALGISNGWYDGLVVIKNQIEFGHKNKYRQIITDDQYATYMDAYENECLPLVGNDTLLTGNDAQYAEAFETCFATIYEPILAGADFDMYDIREPRVDPFPPKTYIGYLNDPTIMAAIGAKQTYTDCAPQMGPGIFSDFVVTGDRKWRLFSHSLYLEEYSI
jgi:hypothetical protein